MSRVPNRRSFHRSHGVVRRVLGHRDVVGQPDPDPGQVEQPRVAQPRIDAGDRSTGRPVLAVAPRRPQRRHLGQLVEHEQLVDVAAVEDGVDAGEDVEHLRPQLGTGFGDVGVGDQPDAHGGALRQRGAHQRDHRAVEHVGVRAVRSRWSILHVAPRPIATWAPTGGIGSPSIWRSGRRSPARDTT